MKMNASVFASALLATCAVAAVVAAPTAGQLLAWQGTDQVFGYSHMNEVFKTRPIKRGARLRDLPRAQEVALHYTLGQETGDAAEFVARNHVAAVLVVSHGKIVLERYGLGQSEKTRWVSFSVAKSVTSTLIGAAIRDGKIGSVDDPLTRYVPELKNSAYDGVTLAQLLEMRTGVEWTEDYEDRNSDAWWLSQDFAADRNGLIEHLLTQRRVAEPGSRFNYNTGETNLAGIVLGRAVGRPISEYLSQKIWTKIGAEADANWVSSGGLEVGGCCISMRARDYARFALFFMHGGVAGGEQVLPPDWTRKATVPYTPAAVRDRGYGWFWWPSADGSYEAIGVFGQSILIDPKAELVVVLLSAWPHAGWKEGQERRDAFLKAVRTQLR